MLGCGRTSSLDVVNAAIDWLVSGACCWLATVAERACASPLVAGTLVALKDVEPGAVSANNSIAELGLINSAVQEHGVHGWPRVLQGPPDDTGRMVVVLERHDASSLPHLREISARLAGRERLIRKVTLATGALAVESLSAGRPPVELDSTILVHKIDPATRLLIIGVNEEAQLLAQLACTCGLDVVAVNPRRELRPAWEATEIPVIDCDPAAFISSSGQDRCSAVVVYTDNHEHSALIAALSGEAFYIGAPGTRQAAAQRRQHLFELGVGKNQLPRLHSPIGFEIGSEAPAENAVAIMAQLLAERHRLLRRAVSL